MRNINELDKKEIKIKYKEQEIEMGIIQVYNTKNRYSLVDVSENLYKPFEALKFKLNLGRYKVKKFQEDWITYGEDAFEFNIVEKLKPQEGATERQKKDDLKELLKLWVESQGESIKLYNKI